MILGSCQSAKSLRSPDSRKFESHRYMITLDVNNVNHYYLLLSARRDQDALAAMGACIRLFGDYFPATRNLPIVSFKNFSSAGLPPAPAVCPQSDGIGTNETLDMNAAS